MSDLLDVLQERGFLEAVTHEQLKEALQKPLQVYCGFDPTSDSLHLGNMVAIMGWPGFRNLDTPLMSSLEARQE